MNSIGVDVGGTFTDVFLVGADGFSIHKVPSTPADPSVATVEGMREACEKQGLDLGELDMVFHGTTVATNTVLQRNGASVGLVTTEGFRDILHIARHKKPYNFSLYQELPWQRTPLVPRHLRLAVRERVAAPEGEALTPLDEDGVREALVKLREEGIDALAVCFLHSYLNPAHERRVAEIAAEELPDVFVSLRHVVSPEYREYESFSTTALNAYVGPVTGRYLDRLSRRLAEEGVRADVLFMTSTGGVEAASSVSVRPVSMLLSGPVAGVVGGLAAGRSADLDSLITLDVGGTSADIGLVHDGKLRNKHWLDNKIGGYALRLSMVDVATIGAGGGSVASVDQGGMLQVGPRSAGADPGPACYGRGGEEPTVTDAQLVLGRLSEDSFLGGRMQVSRDLAERALLERVAKPLGLSLEQAAAGILRVATAHMIDAIELNSVRRGHDPRAFALVAFGGAGALFAADIARDLSMQTVLVPRFPGVAAAMGLLASDVVHVYSRSVIANVSQLPCAVLQAHFDELERRAKEQLSADGFDEVTVLVERYAECRYAGQGYEIRVPAPSGVVDDAWVDALADEFHRTHEREYGNAFRDSELAIVNVGVRGVGLLPEIPAFRLEPGGRAEHEPCERPVWFAELGRAVPTAVHARDGLEPGDRVDGPAIVEQDDSTTVISPGMSGQVDEAGNLLLTFDGGSGT